MLIRSTTVRFRKPAARAWLSRLFSRGSGRDVAAILDSAGGHVPLRVAQTWEGEFLHLRCASLGRAHQAEPPATSLEYLECPRCGARYVARDRNAGELSHARDRWFQCHRCNRRVRSAETTAAPNAAVL